jgi:hypothetical protein
MNRLVKYLQTETVLITDIGECSLDGTDAYFGSLKGTTFPNALIGNPENLNSEEPQTLDSHRIVRE